MERKIVFPLCRIRNDLLQENLSVPVGDGYLFTERLIPYRWIDEDIFQVNTDGEWENAYSIDFDF